MIPNRFVILWNDRPISIEGWTHIEPYPVKTEDPNKITWWRTKQEAREFANKFMERGQMKVVEIQFRIMGE